MYRFSELQLRILDEWRRFELEQILRSLNDLELGMNENYAYRVIPELVGFNIETLSSEDYKMFTHIVVMVKNKLLNLNPLYLAQLNTFYNMYIQNPSAATELYHEFRAKYKPDPANPEQVEAYNKITTGIEQRVQLDKLFNL